MELMEHIKEGFNADKALYRLKKTVDLRQFTVDLLAHRIRNKLNFTLLIINPKPIKMKNLSQNKKTANASLRSAKTMALKPPTKKDIAIPVGSKLDELYMDVQQVSLELNISKRTVRNLRKSGKLSHTRLHGKIFYFRQELVAILEGNKVPKKDSIPLKKIKESIRQNK